MVRETREETGYSVEVRELLWVRDYIAANHRFGHLSPPGFHAVDLMFRCTLAEAAAVEAHELDSYQIGVEWVAVSELADTPLHPGGDQAGTERLPDRPDGGQAGLPGRRLVASGPHGLFTAVGRREQLPSFLYPGHGEARHRHAGTGDDGELGKGSCIGEPTADDRPDGPADCHDSLGVARSLARFERSLRSERIDQT